MHLQQNTVLNLGLRGKCHMNCCPVPSISYDLCTCKCWSCVVQRFSRRCIYKKMHYLTFDLGRMKCCLVPYASCDIWTCKVWSYYVLQLWVDAFTRKYSIWLWPWGQMSHEMLPSVLYIIWPVHLQILKLRRPTV